MLKARKPAKPTRFIRQRIALANASNEHYLRDDIDCGSIACTDCRGEEDSKILSATPFKNDDYPTPHYLVPDTNVLLGHIDMVEHEFFKDVIILQTVMQEVAHRSSNVHDRIKTLLKNRDRRWFHFSNEHRRETYIGPQDGETANDRNDRAIRVCTKWFCQHLQKRGIMAIMLSDDRESLKEAEKDEITAASGRQYASTITEEPDLVDMAASHFRTALMDEYPHERYEFPEFLSDAAVSAGVDSGEFVSGLLFYNEHHQTEATVMCRREGRNICIQGKKNINRVVSGDLVAVKVFPESQWIKIKSGHKHKRAHNTSDTLPTGKVVGIVRQNRRPVVGTVDLSPSSTFRMGRSNSVLFIPVDRKMPVIRVLARNLDRVRGQRSVAVIDGWPRNSKYPQGHLTQTIGQANEVDTETTTVMIEHKVRYQPFSANVLRDCPAEDWTIPEEEISVRKDLRHLEIASIDPPGCTDIDDALHLRELSNGHVEIGVHIADVTYFLKPGTAMDDEACQRSTAVYLVNKRIDMIPRVLSTDICSLHPNRDKLAFSGIWEIDPTTLQVFKAEYYKSVIHTKRAFAYEEAQARIEEPGKFTDSLSVSIQKMHELAQKFRKRRLEKGALVLAAPQPKFTLEGDDEMPVDVVAKSSKAANQLVEEFMLFANIQVAERITDCFPDFAILRRHPQPPLENFRELAVALKSLGHDYDGSTGKSLSESLDMIQDPNDDQFNVLCRMLTTRCMLPAEYFCAGTIPSDQFGHFGIAANIYTHFTSPIRRYPDVLVHRLLAATLIDDLEERAAAVGHMMDKVKQKAICDNMNARHRYAQHAGRSSIDLFTRRLFGQKTAVYKAYVTRIMENGVIVLLPDFGVETVVDLTKIGTYNGTNGSWTVPDIGKVRLFSKVKARVRSQEEQRGLRINLKVEILPEDAMDVSESTSSTSLSNSTSSRKRSMDTSPQPSATGKRSGSIDDGNKKRRVS